MGSMRLVAGKNLLGIEGEVAWATPGSFTVHNFPCSEDGKNCVIDDVVTTQHYQDPSQDIVNLEQRLEGAAPNKPATATKRYVRA